MHEIEGSMNEGAGACAAFDRDDDGLEDGLDRPPWFDWPFTLEATEVDTGGMALCEDRGDAVDVGESVNCLPDTWCWPRSLDPGVHKCGTVRSDSVARLRLVVDDSGVLVAA